MAKRFLKYRWAYAENKPRVINTVNLTNGKINFRLLSPKPCTVRFQD